MRGRHWLIFDEIEAAHKARRVLSEQLNFPPLLAFHPPAAAAAQPATSPAAAADDDEPAAGAPAVFSAVSLPWGSVIAVLTSRLALPCLLLRRSPGS